MLVELRIYKTKPGKREEFIRIFQEQARPALEKVGIQVLGEYRSLEDADTFIWLRSFEGADQRQRLLDIFYNSDYWLNELKGEIVPLLEEYSSHLIEPTASSSIANSP